MEGGRLKRGCSVERQAQAHGGRGGEKMGGGTQAGFAGGRGWGPLLQRVVAAEQDGISSKAGCTRISSMHFQSWIKVRNDS